MSLPIKERYMKISKESFGYKQGLRYIDFGSDASTPIKYLKRKPRGIAFYGEFGEYSRKRR